MVSMEERRTARKQAEEIQEDVRSGKWWFLFEENRKKPPWYDKLWTWFLSEVWHGWILEKWYRAKSISEWSSRGYARMDAWEFYTAHAKWVLPRLKHLRDNFCGTPFKDNYEDAHTEEEWREILHKMCRAFWLILEQEENFIVEMDPLTKELIQEGLDLFYKYYFSLWD